MAKKTISIPIIVDVDEVVDEIGIGDVLAAFETSEIVDVIGMHILLDEIGQEEAISHFGLTIVD